MPVTPPAPPTFSTRIGWPSEARSESCMLRTVVSTAPPAGSGMTMVIGFDGKVCAGAAAIPASEASAARNSRFITTSLPPDVGRLDDRPPLVDLGLVERGEPLRRLLLGRRDIEAELEELGLDRLLSQHLLH